LADLGTPDDIFYRRGNLADIHSLEKQDSSFVDPISDYFFNYFDLGIDVLFDGHSHKIRKLVLHTNLITKADFGRYSKCHFQLKVSASDEELKWIYPHTKWPEIESIIGLAGEPLLLSRGTKQENVSIRSSYVYAHKGVLFEVIFS
jgi:hypothetical protein